MKTKLFSIFFLISAYVSYAQTLAYDATYLGFDEWSCIDLTFNNPKIKGHQNNVSVTYFETLANAQNNVNEIPRFYNYSSNNQVLYARVTNNSSGDFATSQLTLNIQATGFPFPNSGFITISFCDVDADGSEEVKLSNLRTQSGNVFDTNFCGISDSQTTTTFYLTQNDAQTQSNSINETFIFTGATDIYYRVSNSVNSSVMIHYFGLDLITCAAADDDNDGLDNAEEDVNRNGDFTDDDTDNDGLKNYEDSDDDGDTILTINEDYNNNNDPSDDDTNNNSIPDYLEFSVTLSVKNQNLPSFKIYPNPVANQLFVVYGDSSNFSIEILDINGKLIDRMLANKNILNVDVSHFNSGVYFIRLKSEYKNQILKFIKL